MAALPENGATGALKGWQCPRGLLRNSRTVRMEFSEAPRGISHKPPGSPAALWGYPRLLLSAVPLSHEVLTAWSQPVGPREPSP